MNCNTNNGMFISADTLESGGLGPGIPTEVHALPNAVLLLRGKMTALNVIQTAAALDKLAAELLAVVANACGPCGGCANGCPFEDGKPVEEDLDIPDYLLEAAELPEGAMLTAVADPETHRIIVTAVEEDISDVPPEHLALLSACGVCLGELNDKIVRGEIIYGE